MINPEKISIPENGSLIESLIPSPGYFIFINTDSNLYKQCHPCRDYTAINLLEKNFTPNIIFCFAAPKIRFKELHDFLMLVEDKLKISEKNRTVIHPTNNPCVINIKPAPFWMRSNMRKSLFTMFIRCGAIFFSGDFESALQKYELTKACSGMVEHFLKGHTMEVEEKLTEQSLSNHWGFYYHYRDSNVSGDLGNYLRKPKKKSEKEDAV